MYIEHVKYLRSIIWRKGAGVDYRGNFVQNFCFWQPLSFLHDENSRSILAHIHNCGVQLSNPVLNTFKSTMKIMYGHEWEEATCRNQIPIFSICIVLEQVSHSHWQTNYFFYGNSHLLWMLLHNVSQHWLHQINSIVQI